MVKSLVMAGCVNPVGPSLNTTQYWTPYGNLDRGASEDINRKKFHEAGVLSRYQARISSHSLNSNLDITVRKNNSDTSIALSIPSGTTGTVEDVTNTVSIASGDYVSIKTVNTASTGSAAITYMSMVFTPTDTNVCVSFLAFNHPTGRTGLTGASTRYYQALNGYFDSANTSEATSQLKMQYAADFKNMITYVASNSRTTNTSAEFRKGGASQSLATTYGNVETLEKSNTANTVTVADDDLVNFDIINGTGTSAISWGYLSVEMRTSGSPAKSIYMGHSQIIGTQARNTTRYFSFQGYFDALTAEATTQFPISENGFTAKNLGVYISQNSLASGTTTFALRKNGSTTALAITVPNTQTGWFEDASNSVSLAEDDEVNMMLTSAVASGSQTITLKSFQVSLEASNPATDIDMNVTDTKVLVNKFITKV
jgi:hypothetical protein